MLSELISKALTTDSNANLLDTFYVHIFFNMYDMLGQIKHESEINIPGRFDNLSCLHDTFNDMFTLI